MDRERFEQLVSEWLDEPGREDLRARIEAAAADSPELARLRGEWLRLDRLVRTVPTGADQVDWPRLRQAINDNVEVGNPSTALNGKLRELTSVRERVFWPRFRRRVAEAVAGVPDQPTTARFPYRRTMTGVAALAAAVALLMFALPTERTAAPPGVAWVEVVGSARTPPPEARARPIARVRLLPPPETDQGGVAQQLAAVSEPQLAEVFLMVEPAQPVRQARRPMIPLGVY
jgi:hypothetical protein